MPPQSNKPKLLLVDDHPHNLIALEAVLGTSDYELVNASSGQEALALVQEHDFAIILLDIHMPEMDGYEVARRLKATPRTRDIPLILITAIYKDDPYVQMAYAVGAVDYFSKPFNPDVLRLKVGIYADLYRKSQAELGRRRGEQQRDAEIQTILETITDPVYVGDENGITRCNQPAKEMFGLAGPARGEHFARLAERIQMRNPQTNELIPPMELPYARALRGEAHLEDVKIRHASRGEDLVVACAAVPVCLDGQILGAVVVHQDVTGRSSPSNRTGS